MLTRPGESVKWAGHVDALRSNIRRLRPPTETPILWIQMKNWISGWMTASRTQREGARERKFQTLRDVYVTMYAEISRRLKAVRWGFAGGSYLWHLPRGTIVRLAGICRQSLAVIACPYTFQPFLFLLHLFNFAIFFLFLLFIFPCSVHRLLKGRIWEIWIKRFFPFLFFYDHFNNVK